MSKNSTNPKNPNEYNITLALDFEMKRKLQNRVALPCIAFFGVLLDERAEKISKERFMRFKYRAMALTDCFLEKPLIEVVVCSEKCVSEVISMGVDIGSFLESRMFWIHHLNSWLEEEAGLLRDDMAIWRKKIAVLHLISQIKFSQALSTNISHIMEPFVEHIYEDMMLEQVVADEIDERASPQEIQLLCENKIESLRCGKISAQEFLSNSPIDSHDLDEFEELQDELQAIIYRSAKMDSEILDGFIELLEKIAFLTSGAMEFSELGYAILSLSHNIKRNKQKMFEDSFVYKILLSITEDLQNWRRVIFVEKSAKDIHYLDDSLLSSIAQLDAKLSGESIGGDLELF